MTKRVFDNDGVAHAWARGADDARSNNGNMYSTGRKLYSYGSHFVLGVRCGVSCFALNANHYSISTSKHKSYTRRAAHGAIHYFPNLTAIADALARIADYRNDYEKPGAGLSARVRTFLIENATGIDDSAGVWLAEFSGLRSTAWAAIKRERARLDAVAARNAEKAATAESKHLANHFATMPESAWRDVLALSHSKYQETYKRLAASLYAAQRYAKAHGFSTKRLAILKTRRVQALYVRDNFDLLRGLWKGREGLRNQVETVRSCQRFQRDDWGTAGIVSKVAATRKAINALEALSGLTMPPPYGKSTNVRPFPMAARHRMQAEADRLKATLPDLESEMTAWQEAERERQRLAAEEERRVRLLAEAERKELWLVGESARYGMRLSDDNGGALIRAVDVTRDHMGSITGGTLETGHGADVPLTHAIKAFRFVKMIRAAGEVWERNGRTVRVGHYQLDRVDADGFTAGCHRINWPEIERLALELGVYGAEPCDAREPSQHAA